MVQQLVEADGVDGSVGELQCLNTDDAKPTSSAVDVLSADKTTSTTTTTSQKLASGCQQSDVGGEQVRVREQRQTIREERIIHQVTKLDTNDTHL